MSQVSRLTHISIPCSGAFPIQRIPLTSSLEVVSQPHWPNAGFMVKRPAWFRLRGYESSYCLSPGQNEHTPRQTNLLPRILEYVSFGVCQQELRY